ncbi:hypothetical protein [Aquihabitans sp. McL0605]|uniref:hypothetical protein n=1 Tax=Aquihabitans sp. McL0605 TaxID=3415671 RepID=UPI003CEBB137
MTEPTTTKRRAWALPSASRVLPYAMPAVVAAVFGAMAWAHRWLHEDGLINIRVVQNLVAGRGPVYNAGERIEAFTSPVQVAFLALGRILTFGLVPIETVVFVVGVGCSVVGLWLVMAGAMHLWGADVPGRLTVPVGAIAFVAVPLTWDFATSGHEGSVGYLWIGACFYGMARRVREQRVGLAPPVDRPHWLLVVLGSGALVRPEFAMYTFSFLAVWLILHRGANGSRLRALTWAVGPTIGYQIFRMGYYGLVLPNTALAKLGGPLGSKEGWHFLASFIAPFVLWLPLLLLAALLIALLVDADARQRLLVAAFVVPALVNIAYLVSIGGDYVNGRLLVVPLLTLVAPIAVVGTDRFTGASYHLRPVFVGATAVLLLWASASATTMRPPYRVTSSDFLDARFDARELAVRKWVGEPPTRVSDYEHSFLAGPVKPLILQYAAAGGDLMIVDDPFNGQTVQLRKGQGPVVASTTIGALGVVAGIDVRIIDRLALADPIASHMPADGVTAGHLRKLPLAWVYARMGLLADPPSAAAAKAQTCGALAQILSDTSDPMTPKRFVTNFFHAPANTRVTVPKDPDAAVAKFC